MATGGGMLIYEAVGEGSVFDELDNVIVPTPWYNGGRSIDESYATVGGGCEMAAGHFVVWRGRGNRVWLAEGSALEEEEEMEGRRVVAVIDFEREVSAASQVFVDEDGIWFCATTKNGEDAVRIRFEKSHPEDHFTLLDGPSLEAAECHAIQIEKLWSGERSGPIVWSDPGTLWLGSADGGVARLDLNGRRCRYARGGNGWGTLLFSASKNRKRNSTTAGLNPPSDNQAVIALKAENGSIVSARADSTICLWRINSFPSQSWTKELPFSGGRTTAVAATESFVWAASTEGLVQFQTSTGDIFAVLQLPAPCTNLHSCGTGVWARTEYGIFAYYSEENENKYDKDMSISAPAYQRVVLMPHSEKQGDLKRRSRNDELEARLNERLRSASSIGAAFGLLPDDSEDWSKVSEAIETYFLHRLGQPWIFGPHACSEALTRDLPEVLRRNEGGADSVLAAARNWYRLASGRAGGVEAKAEIYIECWRQLVEMVKRRDEKGRSVVGAFCCSDLAPLCLVRADGSYCLCLELTAQACDTDDFWTQAEALFAQLRESTLNQLDTLKSLDDSITSAVFENPISALEKVQSVIRDTAREAAALDVDWALECLSRIQVDQDPVAIAQLALFGSDPVEDGHHLSIEALGVLCRAVRYAARRAYERCRGVALVLAAAEAMGSTDVYQSLAVVCGLACEMRFVERMASTAPLVVPLEMWPERRSLLEQVLGQCNHLVRCSSIDLTCPTRLVKRLVARSSLTHAALIDVMDRRMAWRQYARIMTDIALSETCALGDGLAQLLNGDMPTNKNKDDDHESAALRLGDCARSRRDADIWFSAAANAAPLQEGNTGAAALRSLGRKLFVSEGDAVSCTRVAQFLLEGPEESEIEAEDDDESLFAVYLETGDIVSAFSIARRQPENTNTPSSQNTSSNNQQEDRSDSDNAAEAAVSSRRIEALVEAACERGRLGVLCALPWTKGERSAVDACLLHHAEGQEKPVTAGAENELFDRDWGRLYAFRAWRNAWDEAARACLSLAAKADTVLGRTVALDFRLGASQLERWCGTAATCLAARVAACISLSLLQPDAFVVTQTSKNAQRTLELNSEVELSAGVRLGAARLILLLRGDQDALAATRTARDLGIGLAQTGAFMQALELADLIDTQTLDNCIVAALAKRCIELDALENEEAFQCSSVDDPWRQDASPLIKSAQTSLDTKMLFGHRSRPAWTALRAYIESKPDAERNFDAAKAAAHTILSSGRQTLPHWLLARFSGGFARADADPAALLRLYLKYDHLPEALHLAADLLDDLRVQPGSKEELGHTTFVPFSHIEALLRAAIEIKESMNTQRLTVAFDDDLPVFPADDAELLSAAETRLRNSLRRYLTDLAHSTQLNRAVRTLSATA